MRDDATEPVGYRALPTVVVRVTFLTRAQGGRAHPPAASWMYRPHFVVEPASPTAVPGSDYLGVTFSGDGRELALGVEHVVEAHLVYHPGVDYSALVPGAQFTVREGPHVVAHGRVERDP